jgi:hypothetical protein
MPWAIDPGSTSELTVVIVMGGTVFPVFALPTMETLTGATDASATRPSAAEVSTTAVTSNSNSGQSPRSQD